MGFALPSGVINTNSAYVYADTTFALGVLVKELADQTLVVVDYSKLTPAVRITSWVFKVDVSSNPSLVISYPQIDPTGAVLTFLLTGGISGQQYNIQILTQAGGNRTDTLTVNIPAYAGECVPASSGAPAIYNQLPHGTQAFVNTGLRYFWGVAPPANPLVGDQWFDTDTGILSEWATDGTIFSWEPLNSGGTITEPPFDSKIYSRYNGNWLPDIIQAEAPVNGLLYSRGNNGWLIDPIQGDAPSDGKNYGRSNGEWLVITGGGGGGAGGPTSTLVNSTEKLTIATANVIPPIANSPSGGLFMLIVNGLTFTIADGSFSVSGQTVTWLSTIYSIESGATVVAIYSYVVTTPAPSLLNSMEAMAISTANVFPQVAHTPAGGLFMLIVNGAVFTPVDGSIAVSGRTITWLSGVYSVQPGATVVAVYSYSG